MISRLVGFLYVVIGTAMFLFSLLLVYLDYSLIAIGFPFWVGVLWIMQGFTELLKVKLKEAGR